MKNKIRALRIFLIALILVLSISLASARNLNVYNSSNETIVYFSVNGTTGNTGLGLSNPSTLLQLLNNRWISSLNNLTTGVVNMFKVNENDAIEVGATLNIGSFEFAEDSGLVTFVDMPVSATPAAGTSESYVFKVDGDNILTIYSEADSSGGVQNKRVGIGTTTPAHELHVIGNVNITGSFNATRIEANEILVNGAVVNRSIDLTPYAPLDSPTFTTAITVPDNSISDDEIDENAAFAWTNTHSFTSAITSSLAIGTAPFTITSTTQVGNLNVSYADVAYDTDCAAESVLMGDGACDAKSSFGAADEVGSLTNTYACYTDGSDVLCDDAGFVFITGTNELQIDGPLQLDGNSIESSGAEAISLSNDDVSVVGCLNVGSTTECTTQGNIQLSKDLSLAAASVIKSTVDNDAVSIYGGTVTGGNPSGVITLYGASGGFPGGLNFQTTSAISTYLSRLTMSGNVATSVAAWTAITHTGIVLSGTLDTGNQWLSGDGGAEGLMIDDNGNVGIGTASPSQELDVAGHINVTGTSSNSTFQGDVKIIGTLWGASPLKVGGGLNVTSPSGSGAGNEMNICKNGVCCPIWKDCDGDGFTYGYKDCDESCSTCYVGATIGTKTVDNKDQDCDGTVDEVDGSCYEKTCTLPSLQGIHQSAAVTACTSYCSGLGHGFGHISCAYSGATAGYNGATFNMETCANTGNYCSNCVNCGGSIDCFCDCYM